MTPFLRSDDNSVERLKIPVVAWPFDVGYTRIAKDYYSRWFKALNTCQVVHRIYTLKTDCSTFIVAVVRNPQEAGWLKPCSVNKDVYQMGLVIRDLVEYHRDDIELPEWMLRTRIHTTFSIVTTCMNLKTLRDYPSDRWIRCVDENGSVDSIETSKPGQVLRPL